MRFLGCVALAAWVLGSVSTAWGQEAQQLHPPHEPSTVVLTRLSHLWARMWDEMTQWPSWQKLAEFGQFVQQLQEEMASVGAEDDPWITLAESVPAGPLCHNLASQQGTPQPQPPVQWDDMWFRVETPSAIAADSDPADLSQEQLPLVAPPPQQPPEPQIASEDLMEEGCGCYDPNDPGTMADLVQDVRHSTGQQLALRINEENDGLNDPLPALLRPAVAQKAPWVQECDDFCHAEAVPTQVDLEEVAVDPPPAPPVDQLGQELLRRTQAAWQRLMQGVREAVWILRYGNETPTVESASPSAVPHNARQIRHGDIGL